MRTFSPSAGNKAISASYVSEVLEITRERVGMGVQNGPLA